MSNSYQQVSIAVTNEEQKDIILALMADAGFEGFVDERSVLKAFIPSTNFEPEMVEEILQPLGVKWETETIEQRNWNAEWEAGFEPVVVDGYCAIRADFHEPVDGVTHDIIITPKMSFGTGHHATTYMMVEAMRSINFDGKKVLDFGTGTGILAILAEKMGAASVMAIDNDAWSIENTGENIARNGCSKIEIQLIDSIPVSETYNIILANINRNVVLSQLGEMVKHSAAGGFIVISGLLQSDGSDLLSAIEEHSLTLINKLERNSWLCWELVVKETNR